MNRRAVFGFVASNTVISILTIARVEEGQKHSKTIIQETFLMPIRANSKKPLLQHD